MKFLSSTLTLSLKFIFFVTFTIGVLLMSILHTYLDRSYYTSHFSDKLAEIQSRHVERVLEEKKDDIPFGISAETVSSIFKEIFTVENIKSVSDTLFDSVENYKTGETIIVDLSLLKTKEAEFINKLAAETNSSLRNEAKAYLSKNINLGIPPRIEIETENTNTDKILLILQFILTKKFTVTVIILAFMLLPLVGIFALNAHPYYIGIKKSGLALMMAGLGAALLEPISRLLIKSLYLNDNIAKALQEAAISFNEEMVGSIFDFAFGKMLSIITITGVITLGAGIALYVISRVIQKKYEYTY